MSHWTDYLTDAERRRIDELNEIKREAQGEFRRIYDRCRKRAVRSIAAGNGTLPRDYNPYELALIEREPAKGRGHKRNARSQHRETPHG